MEVVTREANANDLDRAAEVLGEAFADYIRREQDTLTGIATAGM